MILKLMPAVVLASMAALSAEKQVQMKDLPQAVQKTVNEQVNGAKLKGISKETEKGKTYYEAETIVNGRSRDVLISASGEVVEVEEGTSLADVPEPARVALQRRAGTGKVLSVESVTRGSAVTYEAVIKINGKTSEVAVNANGEPIQH